MIHWRKSEGSRIHLFNAALRTAIHLRFFSLNDIDVLAGLVEGRPTYMIDDNFSGRSDRTSLRKRDSAFVPLKKTVWILGHALNSRRKLFGYCTN